MLMFWFVMVGNTSNNNSSNSGSNIITPVGGVKRKPAVCAVWIVLLFAVIKISKG
jgi:hypothetical protein